MKHILSVLLENRPGELARVIGLFCARGINIESLTVAETTDPDVSRMTVAVTARPGAIEHITRLVGKQVRVLRAIDLTAISHIEREMVLLRVNMKDAASRQEILGIANVFKARVLDASADAVTLEAVGEVGEIAAMIELLRPLGISEAVRTGAVAIARLAEQPALHAEVARQTAV